MSDVRVRNPRREATALLDGDREGLVLEPSPTATDSAPWFADDPLEPTDASAAVVSPVPGRRFSWADVVDGDEALSHYARDHWLANLKPLGTPPENLASTRSSLNVLAFYVVAPARQAANGKIGLRWTKGGFGTPFFGNGRQIRVEGDQLVVQNADAVTSERITTLRAAGQLAGIAPGPPSEIQFQDEPPLHGLDDRLPVDPGAVGFLDDWFGFSTHVLERLRREAGSPPDTRVQLWPEHFDVALELGDAEEGRRASYGASPGDAAVPQPYLYVSPWTSREGDFWNAPFGGAMMTLDQIREATDQVAAALDFFENGRKRLR